MIPRDNAKKFLDQIPASLEILWSLQNFGRNKWGWPRWKRLRGNRLPAMIEEWRKDADAIPLCIDRPRRKVLFVTGGITILEHSLATSFVLAQRNCEVDLVWFGNLRADQSDDNYERRKFQYYYGAALNSGALPSSRHKIISASLLSPSELTADMIEAARAQARVDVVYITRRETVDIHGQHRALFEYRVQCNCDLMSRLLTLTRQNNYDLLVVPNGAVLEYGAAYRFSQTVGLPAGTFEFWSGPGLGAASFGPTVWSMNADEMWELDKPHQLSGARKQRALDTLQARIETQRNGSSPHRIDQLLALDKSARTILICPNVPFDGMFLGKDSIFPTMRDWLVATAKHLAEYAPAINVIVRSHPHEPLYDADETALSILADGAGEVQEALHIIPSDSPISTYELMRLANLGVVYSSTTAVEMAAQGIPVVCGNLFHYNGKGFTHDPRTTNEYFQTIDRILASPDEYRLSEQQVEMALSYLDIYFNEYPRPFPWTFENFWPALDEWPVRRVMSAEGDKQFGEFFDRLLGIARAQSLSA